MTSAAFVDYAESIPRQQRLVDGADLTLSSPPVARDFFGRGGPGPVSADHGGPEAFLIDFPARSRTGAHFHSCDQFQAFFPSAGAWYKKRPVSDIVVHYVDAYTTYGPFGTADEPMAFYTLRAQPSSITGFMPAARDRRVKGGKRRNITADAGLARAQATAGMLEFEVIRPQADGLAATLTVLAGGSRGQLAACAPPSAGHFVCVVEGDVTVGDRSYGYQSLGWRPAGEPPAEVTAGTRGCALLTLQFPEAAAPPAAGERIPG